MGMSCSWGRTGAARGTPRRTGAWLARWPLAVLLALLMLAPAPGLAAAPVRHVLVLYPDNRMLPATAVIDEALNAALQADASVRVELASEFLGLDSRVDGGDGAAMVGFMRSKYAGVRIDVVVAVRESALGFALAHRDALFPGAPIVHAAVNTETLADRKLPPDVLGATIDLDPAKTIELALSLHPGSRRLVVITGTSAFDRAWERVARRAFEPLRGRIAIDYWAGLSMKDILARVAGLPPDALVFLPGLLQDGEGQRLVPQRAAVEVVAASPVPVYGATSNFRENSTAGGFVAPIEDIARTTAQLVARLVRGERPEALGPVPAVRNAYVLNMHQLARFGVAESQLPAGAILKYRQPSIWQQYRWQIAGVVALVLLQGLLIAVLLAQRRARRRIEHALAESERRMSQAATATGLCMWTHDKARNEFWANDLLRRVLGLGASEPCTFELFFAGVHPDDREQVQASLDKAWREAGRCDVELRAIVAGGATRWAVMRASVERDAQIGVECMRGVVVDITARKKAELEASQRRNELVHLSRVGLLGQLSGSLAHELNQPLTAILSNAQAALRFLKVEPVDVAELQEILADIVADDQRAGAVIRRLRTLFMHGEAKRERIDIHELVREVLQLMRGDLALHDVDVRLELDAQDAAVLGDSVQLQQVLLNLVLNACEAMAGAVPAERVLRIGTERSGNELLVLVTDRGAGIAIDQLEAIFQPFVTTKDLGIGLGLSISRSIVLAHGGRLWAAGNADRGATLRLALPLLQDRSADPRGRAGDTAVPAPQTVAT